MSGELSGYACQLLRAALMAQTRFVRGEPEGRVLAELLATAAELLALRVVVLQGFDDLEVCHVVPGASLADLLAAADSDDVVTIPFAMVGDAPGHIRLWPKPCQDRLAEAMPVFATAADMAVAIVRRRRQDARTRRQREALQVLNDIAAFPEIEPGLQFSRALALGSRFTGMSLGVVLRVEGSSAVVVAAETPDSMLQEGQQLVLSETFCEFAWRAKDVVTVSPRFEDGPDAAGLLARIGAPIRAFGHAFGVVAFATGAASRSFDDADREFVRLLARWLGSAIERGESVSQIARSELQYRSLIASLAEGVVLQDADGKVVSHNASAEHILGLTAAELEGRSARPSHWRMVREDGTPLPPEEHPAHISLARGEPTRGVVVGVYRHAEDLGWVSINAQPIFEGEGTRPSGVVCSFFDVTAHKMALEEQREAAARVRGVVDTVADAILTIDERGDIEGVNPAAELMFGYAADELKGQNVRVLMSEATLTEDLGVGVPIEWVGRSTVGGGRGSSAKRRNGEVFPVEVAFAEMQFNDRYMFTGVIRDVTEQHRIEEALEHASAKSQSLLDAIPDLMLQLDEEGRFVDHQQGQGEAILQPDFFIGRSVEEAFERDVATRVRKAMIEVLARGGATVFEYSLAGHHWEARLTALSTGGFLAILRDITERKRVERMKAEFVSTVSHELRTPLTSIRGSLGLVSSGKMGAVPDKVKNLITIAQKNSERLSTLINDILDIEKLASGKMRFDLVRMSLDEIVAQAVEANRGYGQPLEVGFALTAKAAGAFVSVDQDRFLQVMANLLSNAAKYSPRGGTVSVATAIEDGFAAVSVTDTGPGIPEAYRPRVFERFTQADSSDTRRVGGTGLGLAIARTIVERMGGRIGFDTELGKGTTFHFALPIVSAQALAGRSGERRLSLPVAAARPL